MTPMSDTETSTATKKPAPAAKEPLLACEVVKPTTYGQADLGKGHRIRLPKSEAETLEAAGFLRITGL